MAKATAKRRKRSEKAWAVKERTPGAEMVCDSTGILCLFWTREDARAWVSDYCGRFPYTRGSFRVVRVVVSEC